MNLYSFTVIVLAMLLSPFALAENANQGQDGDTLWLMHYMPWYQTPEVSGYWGSHWTGPQQQHDPSQVDADGLPDIWSNYHPLIGPYDSADPDVIECQLLQMKLAGVDGVIVDWYGTSDAADYGPLHAASRVLFEQCGKLGMRFAVCYEDRTIQFQVESGQLAPDAIGEQLQRDLAWVAEHWFTADHYARIEGKPLLLNFGPIYIKEPATWKEVLTSLPERPAFYALHHLWQQVEADGGFAWVNPEAWEDPEESAVQDRLNNALTWFADRPEQRLISAYPGFRDVYANPHPRIDHQQGQTMRQTLQAAAKVQSPVLQLVTWNDYGEGTIIEPTHEFGYQFLEIIQQSRRQSRPDLSFTTDDLRLPGQFLSARRHGGEDRAALDHISNHLSNGHIKEAKAALSELGGSSGEQ